MLNRINLPEKVQFYLGLNLMNEIISIGPNLPGYFIDFCARCNEIYDAQNLENVIPKRGAGVTDRCAYIMSIFGIMNAEATCGGILQSFEKYFPKLVFPFPGDEKEYNQGLFEALEEFIIQPELNYETDLRVTLWDRVFNALFKPTATGTSFRYLPELIMKKMHGIYPVLLIDGHVSLRNNREGEKDSFVPLILMEFGRDQLNPLFDHKDFLKLSVTMGAALEKLVGICRNEPPEFIKNLCVYGILAGGTKFDVCVAYPDFGDVKDNEFGKRKPFPSFHIIFRYSREFWRFDLFGRERLSYETPGILKYFFESEPESGDSCCCSFKMIQAETNRKGNISPRSHQTEISALLIKSSEEFDISNDDPKRPQVINLETVKFLNFIAADVKNRAFRVQTIIKDKEYPETIYDEKEEQKFLFSPVLAKLVPRGRDQDKIENLNK